MAKLPVPMFDSDQVEPNASLGADPAFTGWHPARIIESENKITKSGTGEYLQMVFEIIDGPFRNRRLWTRLNLVNTNEQAEQIAYAELSSICRAAGKSKISDSQELHGIPMLVNVRYKPASDRGEARNEIASGGYKPADGAPVPSAAPAAAAGGAKQPWRR